MTQRAVVVGAGVTGLVAARELAKDPELEVICLEATGRIGGQVRTELVDGALVDVGAEAIHLGAPHVAALVKELGLDRTAVGAAAGGSLLLTRKGLRPLPAGVGPTGPTRIWPVLKSGILSVPGLLRAGLEPLRARRKLSGDMAVGAFTSWRFGREVTATFVDPLLGNLHGGDVSLLSLQATAPQLVPTAEQGRSMLLKNLARKKKPASRPTSSMPMFASWPEGLETFTRALAEQSRATIRTDAPVSSITREGDTWQVHLADGEVIVADRVLLTTPADVTGALLADLCPAVTRALAWVTQASVATVVLGWERTAARASTMLRNANGVLLPSQRVRTVKAATNLSRKWPELGGAHHLLRASVGRARSSVVDDLDDEQMSSAVTAELHELAATPPTVQFSTVFRFPGAMPQLQPGHKQRLADARAALAVEAPGITIAGCGVDGLGIGATVRSGQQAARQILESLHQSGAEQ